MTEISWNFHIVYSQLGCPGLYCGKIEKLNINPEIQIIVSLLIFFGAKVAKYAHLCNVGAMRAHLENSTLIVQRRKCWKY